MLVVCVVFVKIGSFVYCMQSLLWVYLFLA